MQGYRSELVIFLSGFVFSYGEVFLRASVSTGACFFYMLFATGLGQVSFFRPIIQGLCLVSVFSFLFRRSMAVASSASVYQMVRYDREVGRAYYGASGASVAGDHVQLLIFGRIRVGVRLFRYFFCFFVYYRVSRIVTGYASRGRLR